MGIVPAGHDPRAAQPGRAAVGRVSSDNQKAFAARLQEAFAGFLEHTDAQIGRLVDFLESMDQLDNTICSCSCPTTAPARKAAPRGVMDEFSFFNLVREDIDDIVANRLDDIGGPHAHNNYPWGWAQAGNTPLQVVQAEHLRRRRPRPADHALARRHPGAWRNPATSSATRSTCPDDP